jgi:hypothetical protein
MAKPSKPDAAPAPASKPAVSKPIARTEVRNSPIPQMAPPPRPTTAPQQSRPATPQSGKPAPAAAAAAAARPAAKAVTQELIARRAYEIWASGQGGTEMENWIRAERELRGM